MRCQQAGGLVACDGGQLPGSAPSCRASLGPIRSSARRSARLALRAGHRRCRRVDPGDCARASWRSRAVQNVDDKRARTGAAPRSSEFGRLRPGCAAALPAYFMRDFPRSASMRARCRRSDVSIICPEWVLYGAGLEAPALAVAGEFERAFEQVEHGLRRVTNYGYAQRLFHTIVAEVHLCAGSIDKALELIGRLLDPSEQAYERWTDAELWRLKAAALLAAEGRNAVPEAEACCRQAMAVAESQGSRMIHLRAATSLARLMAERAEHDRARALLAPIFSSFTADADAPDLGTRNPCWMTCLEVIVGMGRSLLRSVSRQNLEGSMRKQAFLLATIALGLIAGAAWSGASAQDKTIKIGALFPMSGPGAYFGAQDKQGIELALEELNKAGVNGYKFAVQYEDSACSAAARHAGRQAPDRPVQAGRHHRRGVLGRDARHHADHRAGEDADDQCRFIGDQDHRSGQSVHLPHHAERGDAGRRYRHAGLQQAQRAHRRAALREHQCGHRQCEGLQGDLREARRQDRRRHRLRPRRQRFHRRSRRASPASARST